MDKDPFKEYIKQSEPNKRDNRSMHISGRFAEVDIERVLNAIRQTAQNKSADSPNVYKVKWSKNPVTMWVRVLLKR